MNLIRGAMRGLATVAVVLVWVLPLCQAQDRTTQVARADREKSSSSKAEPARVDAEKVTETSTEVASGDAGYTIGVDDELTINVWHEPELSQPVVVRPDGIITLPLLNEVRVAGLTTQQLQTKLAEDLKPYVAEPQVSVVVRAVHSRKIYLMGSIARPGAYRLNNGKTVLQAIAEAGGLGPFSKSGGIYILRTNGAKRVKLAFNYRKAIAGAVGYDFELKPDDMVVVP